MPFDKNRFDAPFKLFRLKRGFEDAAQFFYHNLPLRLHVRQPDIEQDALSITHDIYKKLGIPGWEEAEPAIRQYVVSKKGYKKNQYNYDPRTIQLVNTHWAEVFDDWGYERLQKA